MEAKKESEKVLEKKLVSEVKKLGGIALKFWGVSITGFPDRFVLMPGGRLYLVELKSTGKSLSPRQQIVKKFLEEMGFAVEVIDSSTLLDNFLKMIAE